jgi:hypothetical protein
VKMIGSSNFSIHRKVLSADSQAHLFTYCTFQATKAKVRMRETIWPKLCPVWPLTEAVCRVLLEKVARDKLDLVSALMEFTVWPQS